MNKLSVALCSFNGAAFIASQLESIASQTRLPDELVVGDDCSTDDTVAVIEQFAVRAPFPVILHVNDRNVGARKNFERTILRCQGDVIALSDQDDVWLPFKLAKLEAVLDQKPEVGLVFSDADLVDENLHPLGQRLWDFTFSAPVRTKFREGQWGRVLAIANVVTGATMAFRTQFREIFTPIPELTITVHDGWIAETIGIFAKLDFVCEPLILYRQHQRQQLGLKLAMATKEGCSSGANSRSAYDRRPRDYALQVTRLTETLCALAGIEEKLNHAHALDARSCAAPPRDQIDALQKWAALLKDLKAHYMLRGQLPSRCVQRVDPVIRELFARRYHRYSRGILSALSDLVR